MKPAKSEICSSDLVQRKVTVGFIYQMLWQEVNQFIFLMTDMLRCSLCVFVYDGFTP